MIPDSPPLQICGAQLGLLRVYIHLEIHVDLFTFPWPKHHSSLHLLSEGYINSRFICRMKHVPSAKFKTYWYEAAFVASWRLKKETSYVLTADGRPKLGKGIHRDRQDEPQDSFRLLTEEQKKGRINNEMVLDSSERLFHVESWV